MRSTSMDRMDRILDMDRIVQDAIPHEGGTD